ncbi:hypothetical protein Pmi06nite_44680 [Planotetraspora mira]|uniref:Uncharacterized protein n=1 Tax=Planotetraspora mira TaxID=58121 RepID=A0A8J3X869_9ACTN|nr:hypothetical protein Pmi06nite_44680 [Planotetraspora mira]
MHPPPPTSTFTPTPTSAVIMRGFVDGRLTWAFSGRDHAHIRDHAALPAAIPFVIMRKGVPR